jgi:hypothetical protein
VISMHKGTTSKFILKRTRRKVRVTCCSGHRPMKSWTWDIVVPYGKPLRRNAPDVAFADDDDDEVALSSCARARRFDCEKSSSRHSNTST